MPAAAEAARYGIDKERASELFSPTWQCLCVRSHEQQQQELWSPTPAVIRQHTIMGRFLPRNHWLPNVEWDAMYQEAREAHNSFIHGITGIVQGLEQLRRPDVGFPPPPTEEEMDTLTEGLSLMAEQLKDALVLVRRERLVMC